MSCKRGLRVTRLDSIFWLTRYACMRACMQFRMAYVGLKCSEGWVYLESGQYSCFLCVARWRRPAAGDGRMSVFAGDRRRSCACDRRVAQQGLILVYSADAAALRIFAPPDSCFAGGTCSPYPHLPYRSTTVPAQWRRQDLLRGATKQQLVCRSSPYYEDM